MATPTMIFDSKDEMATGRWLRATTVGLFCAVVAACGNPDGEPGDDAQGFTAPSSHTSSINQKLAKSLPLDDGTDLEAAMRGFVATREDELTQITNHRGEVIWDLDEYEFLEEGALDSTNPSLWRQASLNNAHGLFKVTDRVYQAWLRSG